MNARGTCCAVVIVGTGLAWTLPLHPPSSAPIRVATTQVRLASVGVPLPAAPVCWSSEFCTGDSPGPSASTIPVAHAGAADSLNSLLLTVTLGAIGNGTNA